MLKKSQHLIKNTMTIPITLNVPQISKEIMNKIDINKSFKVLNESHIGRDTTF